MKEPHYVSIRVQVQINGAIESSHNQDPVLLYPKKLLKTFINTDKEIYKPGDKIRFRIFTIDEQLLPHNSKGKWKIEASAQELILSGIKEKFPMYDPKMHIHITATITEKGTNRIDVTTGKSLVSLKAYTMKFISNPVFQPGLPYNGKIKLNNIHTNLTNELIEARSLNHTHIGDSFLAVRLFSPSNSYILLQQTVLEKSKDDCRAPQQFTVYYTTDRLNENEDITFYYMIKSQNRIYKLRKVNHIVKKNASDYLNDLKNVVGEKHKFTKLGTSIDNFTLKFRLDRKIGPKYQLLVYYVTKYGETVAVSKTVDVEACLLKVEAKWKQKQMVPGATATLNIKVGAHSLCSVSAIDKSIRFFSANQNSFNANTLFKSFSEERVFPVSGRKTCIAPMKKSSQVASLSFDTENMSPSAMWDLRRRKRHIYSFSEDFDSFDIFNNFGVVIITNLKVVNKPCYTGPLLKDNNSVQFLTGQYDDQNEEKSVSIRSYFPETWLWELVPVSDQIQLKRHLPHSITNWVTNVLCISDEEGLGISQETEITTFQSFFIEIITPYSVKRDENFYLYIHISNYYNHKFPIRITLRLSEGLELKDSKEQLTVSYCLLENNTVTHMFQVKGTKLGTFNATVLAESDNQYPDQCGPETIVSTRLAKHMAVNNSHTSSNVSWLISAYKDIVPDTGKLQLSLNGDLMGKTVENLEKLLDVPTGCGGANNGIDSAKLIRFTLFKRNQFLEKFSSTSYYKKLENRIVQCYQRILNYAHKDGSFSAFGYHDSTGSMFLTAFVVRTLQEAKKHIYVDQRVIDKAVAWIFDHQLENGCFNTMLHGGTSKENSTASLTAYVIISLMEANIQVPKTVQTNAKYCIRSQNNPDKYALALSCYALYKVNWHSEANRMLHRLLAVSGQQQNMLWWSNKDNTSAATDIEITSYVLLSLLNQNTTENLANTHSIVRWLSSKYGPNGGFRSTQDTVVALDALSKYSSLVSSKRLDLNINVETNDKSQKVSLSDGDKLKSKIIILDRNTINIKIIVEGQGCVLAQAIQSYHLMHIPKSEAFKLAVDVAPVSNIDQCSITSVSPCLAYTGLDGPANMAVMEITLPSGYAADRASLYKLVESESTSKIKMFEELKNKINLYFTKLDKQLVCFSFNINENSIVETRKDSVVKLYDYYRPEYEVVEFYRINDKCQYNNSIHIPAIGAKPLSTKIKINNVTFELTESSELTDGLSQEDEKNIVKRSTVYKNADSVNNKTEVDINPDFVDKDIDREFSNSEEENITRINEDFVEKNIDMEFSNCNGNVPYYTTKDNPNNKTKRDVEAQQTHTNTNFTDKYTDREISLGKHVSKKCKILFTYFYILENKENAPLYTIQDIPKKYYKRNVEEQKFVMNVNVATKKGNTSC
ncbi:hypothetical protein NQ314_018884 [Rhamnusium bicolor]|uniref:Uncharacterized protein n=1 Tax=Rhamnusium bicolor TaxID=1586634 RepID=A0AAV8WQ27_9CUCU|nr:hypothetical protein NQ314_018884 [Rhamnusium bicolor]